MLISSDEAIQSTLQNTDENCEMAHIRKKILAQIVHLHFMRMNEGSEIIKYSLFNWNTNDGFV